MIDMRLERVPFEFDGHTFQLCCNMNVLADVQEAFDGKISEALSGKARHPVADGIPRGHAQ